MRKLPFRIENSSFIHPELRTQLNLHFPKPSVVIISVSEKMQMMSPLPTPTSASEAKTAVVVMSKPYKEFRLRCNTHAYNFCMIKPSVFLPSMGLHSSYIVYNS